MMDWSWKIKKRKLRLKYKNLTDKDLIFTTGNEEEIFEKLRSKLGKSNEEILNRMLISNS